MIHIFYFLTSFAIIFEVISFFKAKKINDLIKKSKSNKLTGLKKIGCGMYIYLFCNIFYLFWLLGGLMTFQWPIFLFMLLMAFIPKHKSVILRKVDAVFSILLLIFILLNAYQFQIHLF